MRDIVFYKKIFGEQFIFQNYEEKSDIVKIIDVTHINDYENQIIEFGGNLTVPTVELRDKQKIAYYSDPGGCIFALLENEK